MSTNPNLTPADGPDIVEPVSPSRALIANAAGWIGLMLLVVYVAYWAVTGQGFDLLGKVLLIVALMALGTFGLLNPQGIVDITTGRSTRNVLGTALMLALAVGILGAINIIYGEIGKRAPAAILRVDLTAGQQNTLSGQAIGVARALDKPINVYGFFTQRTPSDVSAQRAADNLLKEYAKYTDKLKIQYIDPDVNPTLAIQYGLTKADTVVFDNGTRHETATANTEEGFTGALLQLKNNVKKTITVLNVPSLISFGAGGSQTAAPAAVAYGDLTKENYTVLAPYDLVVSPTISVQQVDVLIVPPAPPKQPLSDMAVRAVSDYLDKGGHVLLIGDPFAAPLPTALLQKYGLSEPAGHGAIGEQDRNNSFGQSGLELLYRTYGTSLITSDMSGVPTAFRVAEPILTAAEPITGFTSTPLLQSGTGSVYVTFTDSGNGQLTPAVAANGPPSPYNIGVVVEQTIAAGTDYTSTQATKPLQTRLVVIGDYDWLGDDLVSQPVGNLDLFKNTVNWLAQSEDRIAVRPKDTTNRTLVLTDQQNSLIAWSTIVFLPILTLLGGLYVWWRRR
ncbi:MAG: Gldg family protein [Chloroflexota bacterium]|nr:Gldg family protein [Chloroflexota bacterium]